MGKYFFDQYSLLSFAFGGVARYYNVSLYVLLIVGIIIKILQYNLDKIPKDYTKNWNRVLKPQRNTFINILGDFIFMLGGFYMADNFYFYNFYSKKMEEMCLGIIMYFWYYETYGLVQSLIGLAVTYYLTSNNLFLGFISGYIVDYLGKSYNLVDNENNK